MRMPWGKYRGEPVYDLPSSYLCWLAEEAERVPSGLKAEALQILSERFGGPADWESSPPPSLPAALRPVAQEIVEAGYKRLALKRHPDAGGTHAAMLALGDAIAALRRLLAVV